MTITCSNCDETYAITTNDAIVACPYYGQRTFSPRVGERDDDQDEEESRALGTATAHRDGGENR